MFSFGVLLAQLITSEYPRLDTRKEQVRMVTDMVQITRCLLNGTRGDFIES